MKPAALLFLFLLPTLASYAQSSISITNLDQQRKLGREFVNELLALNPEQNSSAKGVIKIREATGKSNTRPILFNLLVSDTNWTSIYISGETILKIIHHDTRSLDFILNAGNNIATNLTGNETMVPFVGSDFWLTDLGLQFLHWPEQRMIKKEMRRSQFCKVIESVNPQPALGAYSKVISWIKHEGGDAGAPPIVHAEAYDSRGKLLKEFRPKELEKINGQWQLREMEMYNTQTKSRTRIEFELESD